MALTFSPAYLSPISRTKTVSREIIPYKVPVKGCNIVWLQDKKILAGEDGEIAASGVIGGCIRGRLRQSEAASFLPEVFYL